MLNKASDTQLVDIALLKAISEQDEAAFIQLYKQYQPKLLKFCAGYLNGDVAQAADIVDDALFDVWNKASSYKETAKVSTWIFTITRNKTVDYLRKKRPVSQNDDEELLLKDTKPSPEKLADDADVQKCINICMTRLSDPHREVILLTYFSGLTIKEIAKITNDPENTIKTRLFHAREKMNTMLTKMGIDGYLL